jgi:hypothetical protein
MKRAILVGTCILGAAFGQGMVPQPLPNYCVSGTAKLSDVACVLPNLFYDPTVVPPPTATDPETNARGITLIGAGAAGHTHHFADFTNYSQNLLSLNISIATQLTSLPIPSPASGFIFTYDRTAGVHVPNPRTLGSILTERAETIGAKRFFFGAAYQRFRFSDIDNHSLRGLPGVFSHESGPAFGAAREDYITTQTNLDLHIDQVVFYGTVGLTNAFDVSLAVPINDVRFTAAASAQINRVPDPTLNPANPTNLCPPGAAPTGPCHFFPGGSLTKNYYNSGSATGIGDINLRLKHSIIHPHAGGEGLSLAILTDVRFPSGDERNFLGSGAYGIKPFVALSLGSTALSPHFNIGYQINGSSALAGDVTMKTKAHLPNQLFYSAGTDLGVIKDKLTIAADYLGQYVYNGPRLIDQPFAGATATPVPRIGLQFAGYGMSNAAFGVKYAIAKHVLFTGNVLVKLDSNGLHQRTTPLIGIAYAL